MRSTAALTHLSTRSLARWIKRSGPEVIRVAYASTLTQNRRQSSIATAVVQPTTTTTTNNNNNTPSSSWTNHHHHRRPAAAAAAAAVTSRVGRYRPQQRNGKAIAFHISDLYHQAASAAVTDDDLYQEEYETATAQQTQQQQQDTNDKKAYESDLVVVLDMDECLIHSQFLSSPQTAQVYAHQLQQQRRQSAKIGSKVVDHFKITLPEGDLVHVNIRPGLRQFLSQCTDRFETHIFTAASAVYAKPVLDNLDPDGTMFAGRWYREHCQYVEKPQRAYLKNLDNLPFLCNNKNDLSRVVLVDNNPLSFYTHPENGILISSFYHDPNDNSLRTVWKLLQKLDEHKDDVRPILTEKFDLENALKKMEAQKIAQNNNRHHW